MAMYICPVCRYDRLSSPPYRRWPPPHDVALRPPYESMLGQPSYEVCPRCGFEFGNDDDPGTGEPESWEEYRKAWEAQGAPWFDPGTNPEQC
jgi:hypothetical protein